jgi:protein involved in polysaccharide export with SLBB domain
MVQNIKIFLILLFMMVNLQSVELPTDDLDTPKQSTNEYKRFGENLFNGNFSTSILHRYNPNYILNIGDSISIKIWGAVEYELKLTIDEQGNVFLPKIGVIKLLGIKNNELTNVLKKFVNQTYKNNVYLYASLDNFQPIEVFVSGAVNKPGLYKGIGSDSILQFVDKARGIASNGSYRYITILRENQTVASIDLYDYLIDGKLNLIQFKNGDVINVGYKKEIIYVEGDCEQKLQIELKDSMSISTITKISNINSGVTHMIISRYKDGKIDKSIYPLDKTDLKIKANDTIKFVSNNNKNSINITITGEHNNDQNIVVQKGTTLKELISTLKLTNLSIKNSINLYRKSIAKLQKELLNSSLKELEASVLKTGSTTTDEAIIRKQESSLVLDFIKRAKQIEPKGRVILNDNTDLSKVVLEDEDTIYIPKTTHIITIAGDVQIPSAISYVVGMGIDEYISLCGGLSASADEENILIIKQNGKVIKYDNGMFSDQNLKIEAGDSVLVLGKPDTKNLQITKDITQILYQIAVSAGVLVRL